MQPDFIMQPSLSQKAENYTMTHQKAADTDNRLDAFMLTLSAILLCFLSLLVYGIQDTFYEHSHLSFL